MDDSTSEHEKIGYIKITSQQIACLYASGTDKPVEVAQFTVDKLTEKTPGSALKFARERLEQRHALLRKASEMAKEYFITDGNPNVKTLYVGAMCETIKLSELNNILVNSEYFDASLKKISECVPYDVF